MDSKKPAAKSVIVGHANTFHDPAIAVVADDYIFAEALERHYQCKRAFAGNLYYSKRAVQQALKASGTKINPETPMQVVSTWIPELLKNKQWPGFENMFAQVGTMLDSEWFFDVQIENVLKNTPMNIEGAKPANHSPMKSKAMPHHLAHAANAVFTSPFEECVVMVLDGHGEESGFDFFHFKDNKFRRLPSDTPQYQNKTDLFSQSPGFAYMLITMLCGFNATEGEEWKVMGLAAYGKHKPDLYEFMKKRVTINGLNPKLGFMDDDSLKEIGKMIGGFRKWDDPDILRIADLAFNFQQVFMEMMVDLAKNLGAMGLSKNLAFGGGCALNSSANGKLLNGTGFERLHVPCAPADDGNALGAALYEKYVVQGQKRIPKTMPAYLGSMPNMDSLERAVTIGGTKFQKFNDETSLCNAVADLLAEGKIFGWMQGRAEFGPRALGNRSIIGDPRPKNMKDLINARIKFREEYRPIAPSILHEFGPEYFENYQESPYMERALFFKDAVKHKVPAVVHEDGTGRLQSVKEELNPLYYKLIKTFHQKTGVPILLNTSFNVMGKPIVHSVEDAFAVFYSTGLDHLVIGNYLFSK